MKKLTLLFLIFTSIIVLLISPLGTSAKQTIYLAQNPCAEPITYRIDTVDPQFHLTRTEFIDKVQLGADIWNDAYGKELFKYDPEGKISINLTFDGRQAINEEVNTLENNVTTVKGTLESQKAEFDTRSKAFDEKVQKLNTDIAYWNAQGGAPKEEYQKLLEEQKSLRAEASELNQISRNLNKSTDEFNSNIDDLNQSIDTFNSALEQKPEEGVYSEADLKIDIFFNTNDKTLIRTIAHELGHARGLDHVSNSSAVMYEKTFPDYILTPDDMAELNNACRKRNPQQAFSEYFRNLILDLKRSNSQ